MDFQRFLLLFVFSFSALLLWEGWQREQNPLPQTISTNTNPSNVPEDVPKKQEIQKNQEVTIPQDQGVTSGKKIKIVTDSLFVEVNTIGGDFERAELLQHKDAQDKEKSFVLLQKDKNHIYVAQTGLLGEGLPTHKTEYKVDGDEFRLADGENTLTVKLKANEYVTKTLSFQRGSNLVDVSYEIKNAGSSPLVTSAYFQLVRDGSEPAGASKLVPTYTGPAIYTDKEKFQKVDFPSIESNKAKHTLNATDGWVAMLQHYFVSAWLPKGSENREFYTKTLDKNLYAVGTIVPVSSIAPGEKGSISVPLYLGPATAKLDNIAPGLGLTVDYGWLTIIATPLFWLLDFIHGWMSNWGVAIIVLTILIKLAFFPLSAASYKSMAKMKIVAPKLEKIKQQYSDDREKLNRAMMDLYKTEKINPLGGCLPMLIQIPVFIALYWAILSSVELRHAPFVGWITDLSAQDPYYVLPLIMGISMVIQSKLNPTPPDPIQAKLMQWMPVVFSVVFFFFPAGLVLYSVVNNILSIAQQWYITRDQEMEQKGVSKA